MNEQEIRRWLWEQGYAWDDSLPGGPFLEWSRWDALSLSSPAVVTALRICQGFCHSAMNVHAELLYKEPHKITGTVGAVTEAYIHSPRCPMPDIAPPAGVMLDYEDEELQQAVLSMQLNAAKGEQAVGSGSWPMPCQKSGVHFRVDKRRMPDSMKPHWKSIQDDVVADYRRLGVALEEAGPSDHANIRVSWEPLSGSTIGLAEYNNQSCGDGVFNKMDPGYYPDNDQIRQLWEHELGHNMNLPHTSGGIMNPSITDGWVGFVGSDPSVPRLKRFFGGEPVDPEIPDRPDPDGKVKLTGVTTVVIDGESVGEFIFTPKPEV